MRNKVDINKLIKKKFNDKTFDYSDLDKEMDLILEKLDGYWGKVDTAELEEVSQGESVFDHAFGLGGAENPLAKEPGYGGREPSEVIPYKLAETGDGDSGGKTISIAVPDLFSLITNSEMVPGDQDRKLIQSVILNMKDLKTGEGNWIERIKSLQKYMDTVVDQNIVEARDIRRAISNLIFLNLMKKISFFVAQPGKLFEYIITPLIGTEAKVLGSVDQQITDVTKESQGRTWFYSIKLFTGKTSDYVLNGSRKNLNIDISDSGKPITYIIAVSKEEQKNIEFSEVLVSNLPGHFPETEFEYIKNNEHAILLKSKTTGFIGLLVKKMPDTYYSSIEAKWQGWKNTKNEDPIAFKAILNAEEQEDFNNFLTYSSYAKLDTSAIKVVKPQVPQATRDRQADIKTYADANRDLPSMKSSKKDYLAQDIKAVEPNNFDKSVDAKKLKFRQHFRKAIEFLGKYLTDEQKDANQALLNTKPEELLYPKENSTNKDSTVQADINEKVNKAEQIINLFIKTYSELTKQRFQENLQEAKQKELNRNEPPEFSIGLKTSWTSLSNIKLNLGDPKIYNDYQLKIASNLAEDTEKVLNAYKDLNTNLVKFFATSKEDIGTEPGKEPRAKGQVTKANNETGFGDAVIKNATDIEEGVRGFLEKEGTPSQVKE